jgi:hypothetical protein
LQREASASLLGKLIRAAPRLILPYVSPVIKALVVKLRSAASLPSLLPQGQQPKPMQGKGALQG